MSTPPSWTKIGQDIIGEATGDQSGYSVSMSADGTRMAIGAPYNDGISGTNGSDRGHVRVYQYNGSAWEQMGLDIDDGQTWETNDNRSGYSVSLSANGTRLAVGAPQDWQVSDYAGRVRVFEYVGSSWVQIGADIGGKGYNSKSGTSVSISADGTCVAIGAPGDAGNRGHVRVYYYNGSAWVQMGAGIDGEATGDQSGYSVSLNAVGTRMAIGAINNDGTTGNESDNRGHVRVYEYNGSAWLQMGADIDGEAAGDLSGCSVSMSEDGARIAIGAYLNDGISGTNGFNRGHVRVYQYNGSAWLQMGADIDDGQTWETNDNRSGYSVSLSANGTRLAVGAPQDWQVSDYAGRVRVFEYVGSSWVQIAADIGGKGYSSKSGTSVSISADGQNVAIGAPGDAGNRGYARVYQSPTSAPAPAPAPEPAPAPGPGPAPAPGPGPAPAPVPAPGPAPVPAPGPNPAHQPIEVNLNIAVDASGTIDIFGQEAVAPLNVIVAKVELDAAALYSASNSMFEFWEPSSARGTRLAQLATNESRNWKLLTRKLANGIQDCLEGEFDATNATPFNDAVKYTADVHKKASNFGELALRSYAHYTLGHIDATAAITNDQAFVRAMLSQNASGVYTDSIEGLEDDFSATAAGTKSDANLAKLLVKAIAMKDGAGALAIAEQVLGQDASRAMDDDNNELTVDKKQALKFIAGDIIYMNIQLQKPDVVVASGQKVGDASVEDKFSSPENYTLKIKLK